MLHRHDALQGDYHEESSLGHPHDCLKDKGHVRGAISNPELDVGDQVRPMPEVHCELEFSVTMGVLLPFPSIFPISQSEFVALLRLPSVLYSSRPLECRSTGLSMVHLKGSHQTTPHQIRTSNGESKA